MPPICEDIDDCDFRVGVAMGDYYCFWLSVLVADWACFTLFLSRFVVDIVPTRNYQ